MKVYLVFTILLICCATSKQEKAIDSMETLQVEIVGHQVDEIQKISFSFDGVILTLKDTTLEDEDVSWKGLNYYYKSDLFFTAETSWNNPNVITRVLVNSQLLKTKDGLGVGENFESIRSHIIFNSWSEFPDGYVAFKDSSDMRITYVMNTEPYPQLRVEALTIEKLPPTLKVQNVIVMQ